MRMAEDKFVCQGITYVCYIKLFLLASNLCIEANMKQHVAQFFANVSIVAFYKCVAQFVCLFYRVRPKTLVCLFFIPRALISQFVENIEETPESFHLFLSCVHKFIFCIKEATTARLSHELQASGTRLL